MSTPAAFVLALTGFSLGLKAMAHGRETTVNFPLAIVDAAILLGLLWLGDFFG